MNFSLISKTIFLIIGLHTITINAAADVLFDPAKAYASQQVWSDETGFTVYALKGYQARIHFKNIAALRIAAFADFPYLYAGTEEYEKEYLETYFNSLQSVVYVGFHAEKIVAFSNLMPLCEMPLEIIKPFIENDIDVANIIYLGEAILSPEYQHKKSGFISAMLKIQEQHARKKNYNQIMFMSVIRSDDHPLKPENYTSLDGMFTKFGFKRYENMFIEMTWTQVDTNIETDTILSIWYKNL
jgi:hypothetical protein